MEIHALVSSMVSHYRDLMNLSTDYTWDVDQHIVSYAIISNKLCGLQKSNKLWAELKLEPEPFPDMKTCWHGSGIFEDCNNQLWSRNAMIKYQVHRLQILHNCSVIESY